MAEVPRLITGGELVSTDANRRAAEQSLSPRAAVGGDSPSPGSELGASGVLLALFTLVVLLVALTVRSHIVFGLVVLAAVLVPLERVLALHPQKILRSGWRADVMHYVVNGLLLNMGRL